MRAQSSQTALERHVHRDLPFGPPDATVLKDPSCAAELYAWDNSAFAELLHGSHVLIGRRGAGKSALVGSLRAKRELSVKLSSDEAKAFSREHNLSQKQMVQAPGLVVSVETMAELWDMEKRYTDSHVDPPPEVIGPAWETRIWFLIAREYALQRNIYALPRELRRVLQPDVDSIDVPMSAEDMAAMVQGVLKDNTLSCVVIFDSGDKYSLQGRQNALLAGLCRATSRLIAENNGVDVKLCLPAELIDELERHLFNPGKDFHKRQYLHWTSAELLRVAAHRLKVYLRLYSTPLYGAVRGLSLHDRDQLHAFWERFLPGTVTNDMGRQEQTTTYILRHTHLLPRQVLQSFNSICAQRKGATAQELFATPFMEAEIKEGIKDAEKTNADSVTNMYGQLYDGIDELFGHTFPRLRRVVGYGELHKIWNSGIRSWLQGMDLRSYPEFVRMLLAVGAIGVVCDESSDIYVEGRFEFNAINRIDLSEKSRLCVHPMFSGRYGLQKSEPPETVRCCRAGLCRRRDHARRHRRSVRPRQRAISSSSQMARRCCLRRGVSRLRADRLVVLPRQRRALAQSCRRDARGRFVSVHLLATRVRVASGSAAGD